MEEFVLSGYGDDTTTGVATVESYDRSGRLGRAGKALGISWAAAFATAFIPVAHFILVPGLGLFGLFVFLRRLKTPAVATRVEGTCPDCGADQAFDAGGVWRLPRALTCRNCRRSLKARSA